MRFYILIYSATAAILALTLHSTAFGMSEKERAEEEQRCVWACLANSPGAGSKKYDQCVEKTCIAKNKKRK